ncbi:MAG: FlaD/FlaE family flagellar protein [Haloarculaceae archaeon]
MTINPRDYDLDELRKMARERGDGPRKPKNGDAERETDVGGWGSDDADAAADPSRERFEEGLYRELLPLEAAVDDLEKPYLATLPESYAAEFTIFEWLEYLLDAFGYQGTTEALAYYESVGWLTEDVQVALNDYLLGIDEAAAGANDGDVDDHKLSLVYVARLVSMQ